MTIPAASHADTRKYLLERVEDAAVVQLYADGFDELSLRDKTLIYHLYQAALAGRDIYYDQRYEHNLEMRDVLEEILTHADGIDEATLEAIRTYTKLFWINTGPYNNLTARKFVVKTTREAFVAAAERAAASGARFPVRAGESLRDLLARLDRCFFDPSFDPIVTSKTPGAGKDILQASANNLYKGVAMADLEGFEEQYPLNSRLVKRDGALVEEVYRVGGRYDGYIREIVKHLRAAVPFATAPMAVALEALIRFYETGETADRVAYDIAWVHDRDSPVDTINGFVEVYMDARGVKGAWEALVYYVNPHKTQEIRKLAAAAQWFEDRMPWADEYKKQGVRGISANAIDVVVETGDSGPVTPVGINLPNDQTIREHLNGNPQGVLKEQYSALEESRADLVALYFVPNRKLVELGLVDEADHDEIVRAEYEGYARNALVQLRRVREGTQIEEDHMRNRQMIVNWLIANSRAIDVRRRDGKTYYVMVDARAFQDAVGRLLADVQRIKSEGDYEAAKALFETYGVHFDPELRDEIVARVDRLHMPSYTGFVQPRLEAVRDGQGAITDVRISYPLDLTAQMLEYSGRL
jgi:dipeptidyl-peptidase-3